MRPISECDHFLNDHSPTLLPSIDILRRMVVRRMVAFGEWSFEEWSPPEIGRFEIGRSEIGRLKNGLLRRLVVRRLVVWRLVVRRLVIRRLVVWRMDRRKVFFLTVPNQIVDISFVILDYTNSWPCVSLYNSTGIEVLYTNTLFIVISMRVRLCPIQQCPIP
jgi:hypothetical protein